MADTPVIQTPKAEALPAEVLIAPSQASRPAVKPKVRPSFADYQAGFCSFHGG